MMYPRLKLARNLLTEDGIICISIDANELSNLNHLLSHIFGEMNIVGILSVVNNLKGRSDDKFFATANEYLIVCTRSADIASINGFEPSSEYIKEFKFRDAISNYKEVSLQKTGKNSLRSDRPNMYYPIYFTPDTEEFSLDKSPGSIEILPGLINGLEGRWRWGKEKFLENKDTELTARNIQGVWRIYVKMRGVINGETRTLKPKTLWIDPKYDSGAGKRQMKELFDGQPPFDTPKPLEYIEDLIKIATNTDSIILDFFAGSGTTAHAVMQLNAQDGGTRHCISVQLPEPTPAKSGAREAGYDTISAISRERIRRAAKHITTEYATQLAARETPLDVGFRAYKLVDTNFTKWQVSSDISPAEFELELGLKATSSHDNASQERKLTELLLKLGLSLTENITQTEVAGLPVFTVADGLLLAYMDEHVTPSLAQLRALVAAQPARLVILEDAFQGNDELKTNLVQECRTHDVDLYTA